MSTIGLYATVIIDILRVVPHKVIDEDNQCVQFETAVMELQDAIFLKRSLLLSECGHFGLPELSRGYSQLPISVRLIKQKPILYAQKLTKQSICKHYRSARARIGSGIFTSTAKHEIQKNK